MEFWISFAALIYIGIGLLMGATMFYQWQKLDAGEQLHGLDKKTSELVSDAFQAGKRNPATRFKMALIFTFALVMTVFFWPGVVIWGMVLKDSK